MYENQTFDVILGRMLERVPDDVDKREGSVIYNACAPAAWELASLYAELDVNMALSFADTASGEYLSRRTAEFGVKRKQATKARRKGLFFDGNNLPLDVPIGSRYSIDGVNYVVISKIEVGVFNLESEQTGTIGNKVFGAMLPIDFVDRLARSELSEVLVPGDDDESDESLRQRYIEAVNEPAFGGNVSDYKQKLNAIDGVGDVKVFPVWQGGGTVKCTLITSDWTAPPREMLDGIQTKVDPVQNNGKGLGLAPIGHRVTIAPVNDVTINVVTKIVLETGMTPGQVEGEIMDVIGGYLLSLRKSWAKVTNIVVRVALIEAAILTVPGVIDVAGTTLNGHPNNVTLGEEEIPIVGTVTVNV
ncbi:baseplate J/gp47 family protein [Paenibacillus dendritiformis]|uniref:baseplate J/gp47 family protein n=1 Tax=Paenibacillus dendritiformis TaxID=130049 RepID=UPI000DA8058C|nr:baseplate J/gp47 family protein [Paenibacillus dendritiformis]PZM65337.1 phage tail protein [Paenibacillus dendritiformis]